MRVRQLVLGSAVALGVAMAGVVSAQQTPPAPSPAALLLAKELIDLKGATAVFDPVVTGMIQYHTRLFIQTNPNLATVIQQVAQALAPEMQVRKVELHQQITRVYAEHFSEQELKDLLAFYKTPLGRKLIEQEPKIADDAMKRADDWSKKLAEEFVAKMRAEMKKRGHDLI